MKRKVQVQPSVRNVGGKTQQVRAHTREMDVPDSAVASDAFGVLAHTSEGDPFRDAGTGYEQRVDELNDVYQERFGAYAQQVEEHLRHSGMMTKMGGHLDFSDEEYSHVFEIEEWETGETIASVRGTLLEERVTEGEGDGVALDITVDVITPDGSWEEAARVTPGNYTSELWVDVNDGDALDARWDDMKKSSNEVAEQVRLRAVRHDDDMAGA